MYKGHLSIEVTCLQRSPVYGGHLSTESHLSTDVTLDYGNFVFQKH